MLCDNGWTALSKAGNSYKKWYGWKKYDFSAQKAGKRSLFSASLSEISTLTQWTLCKGIINDVRS